MSSTIHSTKDYSKFKLVRGNRPITDRTIAVKIREMKRKNLLADFPIVVRKNGDGRFQIFDGQNRFEAAKALGLPVFYKISPNIEPEDISRINSAQRGWKPSDFLASFVANGNVEYRKLNDFVTATGIPLSVAVGLLSGCEASTGKSGGDGFREGRFKCHEPAHAYKVAEVLNVFREWIGWATDRSFVIAVSRILRATTIDTERLALKLQHQSRCLVKCANWLQYVEIIDGIYNNRVRGKDIVSIREEVRKWVATNRPDDKEKGE